MKVISDRKYMANLTTEVKARYGSRVRALVNLNEDFHSPYSEGAIESYDPFERSMESKLGVNFGTWATLGLAVELDIFRNLAGSCDASVRSREGDVAIETTARDTSQAIRFPRSVGGPNGIEQVEADIVRLNLLLEIAKFAERAFNESEARICYLGYGVEVPRFSVSRVYIRGLKAYAMHLKFRPVDADGYRSYVRTDGTLEGELDCEDIALRIVEAFPDTPEPDLLAAALRGNCTVKNKEKAYFLESAWKDMSGKWADAVYDRKREVEVDPSVFNDAEFLTREERYQMRVANERMEASA